MGDHPPIAPTYKIPFENRLKGDEKKVYNYILESFLSSISKDCEIERFEYSIKFGEYNFILENERAID